MATLEIQARDGDGSGENLASAHDGVLDRVPGKSGGVSRKSGGSAGDARRCGVGGYEAELRGRVTSARERLFNSATIESLKRQIGDRDAKIVQRDSALDAAHEKIAALNDRIAQLEARESVSDPFQGRRLACAVAKLHGLTFKEMISNRRSAHLVRARQHAMWELREYTGLSLPQIGRLLGRRDHTTVLHGCRVHAARMKSESGADPSRRDAREASASPQAVPAPSLSNAVCESSAVLRQSIESPTPAEAGQRGAVQLGATAPDTRGQG